MSCLRCGRDTEESQVFCKLCLEDMEKYPVKPGISIQLPSRTEADLVRKARPKIPSLEEENNKLIHAIRVLLLVLAALLMAFAICAGLLINALDKPEESTVPPAQNFGSSQTGITRGVD